MNDLLKIAIKRGASDLHISVGLPPMIRVDGMLVPTDHQILELPDAKRLIHSILTREQIECLDRIQELDFSYGVPDVARFRCNIYKERGLIAAAMRAIPNTVPSLQQLGLPSVLKELSNKNSGLILVTGPTGCGKSTTIAAMIDQINNTRNAHIMTIEDPIEYLHEHKCCMIHQRELNNDTTSFGCALRAVLREDPDILLIGEMRDLETISTAITLAETGHLVFGTLHTRNAPQTIDRIVDVFPTHQQDQIKVQLSNTLEAVIAQQLVPRIGGGRIAVVEVMIATSAIRNLIRDGKTYQLYAVMETGAQYGMRTIDKVLADAHKDEIITYQEAINRAVDKDNFMRLLKGY
ncbi:MAG: type IV pilus twitching motility protein PilT [Armatimonadota bacterium]